MQYRDFGKTGWKISALGFGSMRIPFGGPVTKTETPDFTAAVDLLCRGFAAGINYVDTAYFYCEGWSEVAVGKALAKGWRDKVKLSTKLPLGMMKTADDFWRILEEQLKKLDVDYIDFYHLHGIGGSALDGPIKEFKIFESAEKAKDRGMIRNLSFSFHDKPEAMKLLIDTEQFASVLCQYNLLDTANSEMISYAASKGLGTVAMGPVGGGRLAFSEGIFQDAFGEKFSTPELAMRYVFSHPDLNCALSGMGNEEMVDSNVRVASLPNAALSAEELAGVEAIKSKCEKLRDLYCTGCKYCVDECPKGINIPKVMEALIYHEVYQFDKHARDCYNSIGKSDWNKGEKADACIKCGKCEPKCPQKLKIRAHLERAKQVFHN